MSTASSWTVDYFQINGSADSVGESAIILLVDKNGADGPQIEKAVLVDAGYSGSMVDNLIDTMIKIKAEYKATENFKFGCLQFDAVVISHWDQDHYYGFSYHKDCLLHQSDMGYSEKEKKIQCFKYDGSHNPTTVMYCPWWKPPNGAKEKDMGCLSLHEGDNPETESSFRLDYRIKNNEGQYDIECESVLLGSCQPAYTLGLEIFGRKAIASIKKNTILTVDVLLAKNPPSIPEAPGLYIVGTRTAVLGAPAPKTFKNALTQPNYALTDKESKTHAVPTEFGSEMSTSPSDDGHNVGVIDEKGLGPKSLASDDNANSVLLMIISPDPAGEAGAECTLYTGGDAEWQTERNLAFWVQASKQTVKCIKVGHHGSRKGTSLLFLKTLRPEHILISAGYMHGHPVHELIYYLGAWLECPEGNPRVGLEKLKRIHAGCYPYWLLKVTDGTASNRGLASRFSDPDSYVTKKKGVSADYVSGLQKAFASLDPPQDATALSNFTTMQTQINSYTKSANFTAAETALANAQKDLEKAEDDLRKAKASKAKTAAKKAKEVAEDAEAKAKEAFKVVRDEEASTRFQLIYAYFELIWRKWSMVEYEYCPLSNQAGAKLVQYLRVRLEYGKDPAFKIESTDDTSFEYPKSISQPVKKPKTDDASLLMASRSMTERAGPPTTSSRKRKAPDPAPEPLQDTFSYYLNLAAEREILRVEVGNTLNEDELADDPTFDPSNPYPDVDPDTQGVPEVLLETGQTALAAGTSGTRSGSDATVGSQSLRVTAQLVSNVQPSSITTVNPRNDPFATDSALCVTDANMSHFIFSLLDGFLELSHAVTLSDLNEPTTITLKADDGLLRWWQTVCGIPPAPFADALAQTTLSKDQNGTCVVKDFRLRVLLNTHGEIVYSSNADALIEGFKVDIDTLSSLIDSCGLWKSGTGLLLGLKPGQSLESASLSLLDLFHIVGIEISDLLKAQASQIKFVIDNSQASNGIWYYPLAHHALTYRVCAIEPAVIGSANGLATTFSGLLAFLHCSFDRFSFFGRKDCTYIIDQSGNEQNISLGQACLHTGLHLSDDGSGPKWDAYLTIGNVSLELRIRWNDEAASPLKTFLDWITARMSLPAGFFDPYENMLDSSTKIKADGRSTFGLREASIAAVREGSGKWSFKSFTINFELDVTFGLRRDTAADHIPLMLTFSYTKTSSKPVVTFKGQLWPLVTPETLESRRLDPKNPLVPGLLPMSLDKSQIFISLPDLLLSNQSDVYPSSIPKEITTAAVTLSTEYISLKCTLANADPVNGESDRETVVPHLRLDQLTAYARYRFASTSPPKPAELDLSFSATVIMNPRFSDPPLGPAFLRAGIDYSTSGNNSAWRLQGSMSDVSMATLYSMFPDGDNKAVMNALENISIGQFDLEYDYDPKGLGSHFSAGGLIYLGPVQLSLDFQYNTAKAGSSGWSLDAKLAPNKPTEPVYLGDILGGISPELQQLVPAFLSSMSIAFSSDKDFVDLECDKATINGETRITFSVIAKIGLLEFSFVQVTDTMPMQYSVKKRLLRVTLDKLPPITSVPLLQKLEQPFDQLDFLWASMDLTRSDVALMNQHFIKNKVAPVYFKDPKGSTMDTAIIDPDDANNDVVVSQGCHFMIVAEESNVPTVVLDHAFDGGTTTPSPDPAPLSVLEIDAGETLPTIGPPVAGIGGGTKATSGVLTKKVGPLTISAIAIKYNVEDTVAKTPASVQITFDASVTIGPVSGALIGFGVRFPISCIHHFDITKVDLLIDGIGLGMNAPPVALAGIFLHNYGLYEGGLSIEVEPYNFLAGGAYGVPKKWTTATATPTTTDYRTLFVFAEVDGPLVELEFGELSGVVAGFGYNNEIRVPTIDNVTSFPFLASSSESDPLKILDNYLSAPDPWFQPKDGPFWITAGLTAKAFHVLDIKVAIMVDVSHDVVFGLFGDCTATVPADVAGDAELFAVVDMGIIAMVDFAKGIVKVEGQLTPRSFILSKDCHLSGGFALEYFFENSGHEGDWVFTCGGYHPQFQVPQWYPKPPRVAISWKYDDNISIYGDAYFAVTPKACMGGGQLRLAFVKGDLAAHFDAYADFLINYSPFSFKVDVGVTIDIVYHLDLWFITKDWHIHFDASVHLFGPPVAGTVHVDWCVISFDIAFGDSHPKTEPISWTDFSLMLCQFQTGSAATDEEKRKLLSVKATGGVRSDPSKEGQDAVHTTGESLMMVDASTFSMNVITLVAASAVSYNGKDMAQEADFSHLAETNNQPSFKPMQIKGSVTSTKLTVSVQDAVTNSAADFQIKPIMKKVPKALWDTYDAAADPMVSGNGISKMLQATDCTSLLLMGLELNTPLADEGIYPKLLVDLDTVQDGEGPHAPLINSNSSTTTVSKQQMENALQTWLPQTNPDAVLLSPPPPTPPPTEAFWQNLHDKWTAPTRPIKNLLATWATLSGAVEGDALYTQYMNFGLTGAPPSDLVKNLSSYYNAPPLITPQRPYTVLRDKINLVSAAWGAEDVTAIMRKQLDAVLGNPNNTVTTGNDTLTWTPDYSALGPPTPSGDPPKSLILIYQPAIAYRSSYGPDADISYAHARTVRTVEPAPLSLSLHVVDSDFADVAPLDK